jgi:hypothetical protein
MGKEVGDVAPRAMFSWNGKLFPALCGGDVTTEAQSTQRSEWILVWPRVDGERNLAPARNGKRGTPEPQTPNPERDITTEARRCEAFD